jgi:hypothetical protein
MQYLHISNGGNIRSYKFGENPEEDREYLEQGNTVRIFSKIGNKVEEVYIDTSYGVKIEDICKTIAHRNNISDFRVIQLHEYERKSGNYIRRLENEYYLSQYELPESSTLIARLHSN